MDFCRGNPGFTLSIAYVLLTLCGIFYSDGFYSEFSIHYLKLAETSDLLIVGIGEPASLLMFAGALLIALGFDYMSVWSFNKRKQWAEQPETWRIKIHKVLFYLPKYRESVIAWIALIFVIYTFLFVDLYANWQANRVKSGLGNRVQVTANENQGEQSFMLLGSTANYVFLYSQEQQQASILPVQSMSLMKPAESLDTQPQQLQCSE